MKKKPHQNERPNKALTHEAQVVARQLKAEFENGTLPAPIDGPGAIKHQREVSARHYARRRRLSN